MQKIIPRWYQTEAVDALIKSVNEGKHPVAALPTASGKSIVILKFCEEYMRTNDSDILILSHTKEILKQDHSALVDYGFGDIGVYSAGLKSRTIGRITVAGIQSVYKQVKKFQKVGVVLIDEAHLVSPEEETMYRKFLGGLKASFCGVTATPYRLGTGYIYTGENALFDTLCYDLTTFDNFNRLVAEGWLSKITTKGTITRLDVKGLKKQGGDFKINEMADEFDRDKINKSIIEEIIRVGKDYKKWLIFAIDIEHAENLTELLSQSGILSKVVHSRMDDDRDEVLQAFKDGIIKCIVNVNVLTTGFDVPDIDLLALVRPTDSLSLHVQMIGRGMRIHPDKTHCRVMDFAGNTARLGPINNIQICDEGKKKKEDGEAPTKECKNCHTIVKSGTKECPDCGYLFPIIENDRVKKLKTKTYDEDVFIYTNPDGFRDVFDIRYSVNKGWSGRPDSVMAEYITNAGRVKEQICIEHDGYPLYKAKMFVRSRLGYIPNLRIPTTVEELLKASKYFKVPARIKADTTSKYHRILDIEWAS